jgi:hypothetical protein
MGYRRYILMKHQFQNMKDQFNGKTENSHLAPPFTGHEVYEMVKDIHMSVVSGKGLARILKKMTCERSKRFFGSYRIGKT